jgi:hypothetical protein
VSLSCFKQDNVTLPPPQELHDRQPYSARYKKGCAALMDKIVHPEQKEAARHAIAAHHATPRVRSPNDKQKRRENGELQGYLAAQLKEIEPSLFDSVHVLFSDILAELFLNRFVYTVVRHWILTSTYFKVLRVLLRSKLLMVHIYRSAKMHYKLMSRILPRLFTKANWTNVVKQELCCFVHSFDFRCSSHSRHVHSLQ